MARLKGKGFSQTEEEVSLSMEILTQTSLEDEYMGIVTQFLSAKSLIRK